MSFKFNWCFPEKLGYNAFDIMMVSETFDSVKGFRSPVNTRLPISPDLGRDAAAIQQVRTKGGRVCVYDLRTPDHFSNSGLFL